MVTNKEIRLATEADSASILENYAPFVTDTVITFENEIPTIMEFGNWYDVKWFGVKIKDYSKSPVTPKIIDEVNNTPEFNTIIEKSEQMITDISGFD